jgi:hypothetical protein
MSSLPLALTTGFIFLVLSFRLKDSLIFTVAVVFADMAITGIKAAKKEAAKDISSKGLYRTTEKIVVYFCINPYI